MPNLLLVITGACIVAYVLRETLCDLQKKMNDHDGNHGRSDKQVQDRDQNHHTFVRSHNASLPSSVTEAGGNHRQHSSAYTVIIAWSYFERKGELTESFDGGIHR